MATTFTSRAIGANAVTSDKIAPNAVTADKIALNAVTADKIAPNAVTGETLRLANDEYLRARNAADDDDVQIVKVNNANRITFASIPQFSGTPSAPNDIVNVSYLDARLEGLKPKESVRLATTTADGNLDLSTGGLLTIDGLPTVAGDRILVKNQTAAAENGIYIADTNAWVRAADANAASELEGAYTVVREGSENGLKGWVQTALIGTLGTSPVTFVQFSATTAMIGGDMITVSGATISVELASDSGLESTNPGNDAGQLRIKTDGSTTKVNGSNQVEGLKAIEESFTLTGANTSTGYIDLSYAAYGTSASVNSVTLCLAGFPTQQKTIDYSVSLTGGAGDVTRIDWSGLGLDGFVIPGDKIIVNYTYL